ncbi:transposase [Natronococcus jeotgali]|uniref:transposase n=1 Tax=Natronococcus jeotgali TaxID=413812 RepID=UPI00195541EE|nr:hypothetical protein [Natronococcus jeotgali]
MIKPGHNAAFVHRMEDILNLYHESYDPVRPIICFDESNKELHKHVRDPFLGEPGAGSCYDYTYERNGTRNLFMMSGPLTGWRHVDVTKRRRKQEFVQQMQSLVDEHYPDAEVVWTSSEHIPNSLRIHLPNMVYFHWSLAKPQQSVGWR